MLNTIIRNTINYLKLRYRYINKIVLFLLCLLIIVALYPKSVKFKFEFHKGKPWLHNELIAPFDFPIYKTDAEIEEEKNNLLKDFKAYYVFSDTVLHNAKKTFSENLSVALSKKPEYNNEKTKLLYLNTGQYILDNLFNTGIIKRHEAKDSTAGEMLYLLQQDVAQERSYKSFYTIFEANHVIDSILLKHADIDKNFLLPLLQNVLAYNVTYDENKTNKSKEDLFQTISLTKGLVQNGEKIISKGELITPEKFIIIESLKKEYEVLLGASQRYYMIIAGQVLIVSLLLLVLFLFIYNFRKKIYENNKKLFFIVLQVILMVVITKIIVAYNISLLYLVPVCITPIIIRAFFDTRLAIFVHVITVVFISSFAPNSYEFIIYHLIAGIVAVLSIISMTRRSQLFYTALYIFATYFIFYIGFCLVFDGSLQSVDASLFIQFLISALLNLLAFPFIFFYERLFGFPTDFSLLEFTNTNNPLLRELASKAPGTFQHSLQVATLAEEATFYIGGNPLLVRAGALYHDAGKCLFPYYFIENQKSGLNPHQDISYEESARIIISHVVKGVELARKYKLPEYIIDFIRTHHGTKKTDYFFRMSQIENENINETLYSYRGPLPFSKETTVLMMADAVEAASRSLKDFNEETIDTLVENIIDTQIAQSQYIKSDITFKDITDIKRIFKKQLQNIYHVRIAYPQ